MEKDSIFCNNWVLWIFSLIGFIIKYFFHLTICFFEYKMISFKQIFANKKNSKKLIQRNNKL